MVIAPQPSPEGSTLVHELLLSCLATVFFFYSLLLTTRNTLLFLRLSPKDRAPVDPEPHRLCIVTYLLKDPRVHIKSVIYWQGTGVVTHTT